MMPGIAALSDDLVQLAVWGVLQRDLLDAEVGSERFAQAAEQMRLLMEAALKMKEGDGGARPEALFRSFKDVLTLSELPRQEGLVKSIQSLLQHHLFPTEILPEWAQPRTGGTWQAFKSLMTKDIKLFGGGNAAKKPPEKAPERRPEPPKPEPSRPSGFMPAVTAPPEEVTP